MFIGKLDDAAATYSTAAGKISGNPASTVVSIMVAVPGRHFVIAGYRKIVLQVREVTVVGIVLCPDI